MNSLIYRNLLYLSTHLPHPSHTSHASSSVLWGERSYSNTCGGIRQCELIRDKTCFPVFERCKVEDLGVISTEKLLSLAAEAISSLIVVNTRRAARALYERLSGEK